MSANCHLSCLLADLPSRGVPITAQAGGQPLCPDSGEEHQGGWLDELQAPQRDCKTCWFLNSSFHPQFLYSIFTNTLLCPNNHLKGSYYWTIRTELASFSWFKLCPQIVTCLVCWQMDSHCVLLEERTDCEEYFWHGISV